MLTFHRRNKDQILEMEYKIWRCNDSSPDTRSTQMPTMTTEYTSSDTKTSNSSESSGLGLPTILPIVISIVIVITILVVVGCTIWRKRPRRAVPDPQQKEEALYEEIPEIRKPLENYRDAENAYDHLEENNDTVRKQNEQNVLYEAMYKENEETPVVKIVRST